MSQEHHLPGLPGICPQPFSVFLDHNLSEVHRPVTLLPQVWVCLQLPWAQAGARALAGTTVQSPVLGASYLGARGVDWTHCWDVRLHRLAQGVSF